MKVPKKCDCCGKLFDFDSDDIPKFTSLTEDERFITLAVCDICCKEKIADILMKSIENYIPVEEKKKEVE